MHTPGTEYIAQIHVGGLYAFREFSMEFKHTVSSLPPCTIVGGDMGTGKTTLLDAIAFGAGHPSLTRRPILVARITNPPTLSHPFGRSARNISPVVYFHNNRHRDEAARVSAVAHRYATSSNTAAKQRLLKFLGWFIDTEDFPRLRSELDKPVSDDLSPMRFDRFGSGINALLMLGGTLALADPAPRLVLIDELEQHLHPLLQRTILRKLRELVPTSQFVVTSCSAFIHDNAPDEDRVWLVDNDSWDTTDRTGRPSGTRVVQVRP